MANQAADCLTVEICIPAARQRLNHSMYRDATSAESGVRARFALMAYGNFHVELPLA
jgi:hypothetical protein